MGLLGRSRGAVRPCPRVGALGAGFAARAAAVPGVVGVAGGRQREGASSGLSVTPEMAEMKGVPPSGPLVYCGARGRAGFVISGNAALRLFHR